MPKRRTVLFADDDLSTRLIFRAVLEKIGLDVTEAADGQEAVDLFSNSPTDIVLLDACMPRLDGFGACQQIRKLGGGKDVPILMVTSLADSDSVKRASVAGVTDFITKPINWTILNKLIEGHIGESTADALSAD